MKSLPWREFLLIPIYFLVVQPAHSQSLSSYIVQSQAIALPITIDGRVEAVNRATVSAQTSGRIIQINYDVNDYVQKGSVLMRIANKQQRAKVAAAEAQELEAQAAFNVASKEYERIKGIFERNLLSKSDLDRAEATLKSAKERLSAATARLHDASAALKYSVVLAPYSGVVVERHVEVGELAKEGQPLITGLSLSKLRVSANVSQHQAALLRKLDAVNVRNDDRDAPILVKAENLRVSPQADFVQHTFITRADLPQDVKNLFPGMFVKLEFDGESKQRLLIPMSAVANRSELRAVYLINSDGNVALRQVRLGDTWPDGRVEVLAGLRAGDKIALDPNKALLQYKTGDKATDQPAEDQPAADQQKQ